MPPGGGAKEDDASPLRPWRATSPTIPGSPRNRGPGVPAKSRWWGADFVGWGGGVRVSWGGRGRWRCFFLSELEGDAHAPFRLLRYTWLVRAGFSPSRG